MQILKDNEQEEEFNLPLTPLIDVVFLLIIFFLVATTFYKVEKDINIKLPKATEGADRAENLTNLVVNVREGGLLVVNGRITTLPALQTMLFDFAKKGPNRSVIIRGDKKAFHKDVVRVMNACVKAKITNVAIATFKTEEHDLSAAEMQGE